VKIYPSLNDVKRLSKKVTREVRAWGDEIYLGTAQTIVARMFGHDSYHALYAESAYADTSPPDWAVGAEDRERRRAQYINEMSQNDFSAEEAEGVICTISQGNWWGLARAPALIFDEAPTEDSVAASPIQLQMRDPSVPLIFARKLERAMKQIEIDPVVGPRKLAAKLFGYDTFAELSIASGHGLPCASDRFVSPEELDRRVTAYLKVLSDVGIDAKKSTLLLHIVEEGGWWGIEVDEWQQTPRQARHAYTIQAIGRAKWRIKRPLSPDFGDVVTQWPKVAEDQRQLQRAATNSSANHPSSTVRLWPYRN